MSPQVIADSRLSLIITSINHVHLIHIAIAIIIVFGEINRRFDEFACLAHHLSRMGVVAIGIVLAIVRHILRHFYRPHHIERQVKLPITLVVEIVADRTYVAILVEAFLVVLVIKQFKRFFDSEGFVGKFHKDDEHIHLALHMLATNVAYLA